LTGKVLREDAKKKKQKGNLEREGGGRGKEKQIKKEDSRIVAKSFGLGLAS